MVQTATQMMKAMAIEQFGDPDNLHIIETKRPECKSYEVLIQVSYAGVNPVDAKICNGRLKDFYPYQMPLIPGWDVSGKVVDVGSDVTSLKAGDDVIAYCRKPSAHSGAYADFITFHAIHTVRKPKKLSHAEGSVIPLAGLTAWQALFDLAHLKRGQTIFIQAGAGGVGSFAIQFAKNAGACVITTASQEKHAYLRSLGADYPIDYKSGDTVEQVRKIVPKGVDVALEMIAGQMQSTIQIMKPGGFLVSILEPFDIQAAVSADIYGCYHLVRPDGWQLQNIAHLIDKEMVKVPQLEIFPLENAVNAHQKINLGHTLGKITLEVNKNLESS